MITRPNFKKFKKFDWTFKHFGRVYMVGKPRKRGLRERKNHPNWISYKKVMCETVRLRCTNLNSTRTWPEVNFMIRMCSRRFQGVQIPILSVKIREIIFGDQLHTHHIPFPPFYTIIFIHSSSISSTFIQPSKHSSNWGKEARKRGELQRKEGDHHWSTSREFSSILCSESLLFIMFCKNFNVYVNVLMNIVG